ncbi:MAG: hypothetical protein B6244_00250 [Candidatus Cloacimonetes bacterium 4572_55]|nr:MAG: hypothetical protein B6244_00250 [Candidatus Cloacimonetes bacterium 4572_55]
MIIKNYKSIYYIILLVICLSGFSCQDSENSIRIQAKIQPTGNSSGRLSVGLTDQFPEKILAPLNKGLTCSALFEISESTEGGRRKSIKITQAIRYDIWNKTYHCIISDPDTTREMYLPGVKKNFPRITEYPIDFPPDRARVRLLMTLDHSKSESSGMWKDGKENLRPPMPEESLPFGLGKLIAFWLYDPPLLSYRSKWITPELFIETEP